MRTVKGCVLLAGFLAAIVLANAATQRFGLVAIPFGLTVTAGTFMAGAALILRDGVHEYWGRLWTIAAILAGAVLTLVVAPALAVASALAFLASELVDLAVYQRVRPRSLPAAIVLSSLAAAPVDTLLFLRLAGFPITIQSVAGQVIVKTVMALIVGGIYVISDRSEKRTQPTYA